MIRMLHFADIHVGMENYGRTDPQTGLSSRVRDFLHRMDEMVSYAWDHEVDLVVFAGDAFKNRQPNPTFQREFAARIVDLSAKCPVVLLVGNHDMPISSARASTVEIYETLNVPNVLVGHDYDIHSLDTRSGPVQVATAPYPIRARLLEDEATQGKTIAQIDEILQHHVQLILRDLALRASESDAPRVLAGHFTVAGAEFGSERSVMIGRDVSVLLSEVADPAWDYVALGHIHKHQNLTRGRSDAPPVVYSGSMERIDFGEEGDSKGFCWVELERGAANWEFVPVKARPFVTMRIDARTASDPTQHVLNKIDSRNLEDAVVRVIIQADPNTEMLLHLDEIREALHAKNVNVVAAVQKEVERPARARLGGSPEGLTPIQLLERYLLQKGMMPDRISLLLERAEPFLADEAAQG